MPYADLTSERARVSACAATKRYYRKNRETILEKAKGKKAQLIWYHGNREKCLDSGRRCRQRKRDWFQQLKLARGCADCGYAIHHAALDFDHVRRKKLFTIGTIGAYRSRQALEAEVEKCDVVCANCHRIRTYERRSRK